MNNLSVSRSYAAVTPHSVAKGDKFTIRSNPSREIEVRHASPVGVLFKVEGETNTGQQVFFIHANDTDFWKNARLKEKVS